MTDTTPLDPFAYPSLTLGQKGTAYDAARKLHNPVKRWISDEMDEHSWTTLADLLTYYGLADMDDAQAKGYEVQHFTICSECGRAEAETHHDDDEWVYLGAIWPCPTARALGAPSD